MNRRELALRRAELRALEARNKLDARSTTGTAPTTATSNAPKNEPGLRHWVEILSHLSQLGLLVFGILTYVYTIKPVFDKAKLDQDIAQKTEELAQKNAEIARAKTQLEQLTSENQRSKVRLAQLNQKAITSEQRAADQYVELRANLASRFVSVARGTCFMFKSDEELRRKPIADCLLNDALPASEVGSLTKKDLRLLKQLTSEAARTLQEAADRYGEEFTSSKRAVEAERDVARRACAARLDKMKESERSFSKSECDIELSTSAIRVSEAELKRISAMGKVVDEQLQGILIRFAETN